MGGLDGLFRLDDKVVLLTGASSGLGAQWAPVLADAGAKVALVARREPELRAVADRIDGSLVIVADLTSEADCRRIVDETVAAFGRIDVLVNNAGAAVSEPALEMTPEDFRALIEIDLNAVFALTQLVGRHMVTAGRGSVVNVTSVGADRTLDRYPLAAYSAAKAGVAALTRSLAAEWGPHNVRVNAVAPAFFPTPMSGFLEDPEQVAWICSRTALARPPRIDELDGAIVFLASDASSYITGQHLRVDGGWTVF